nr:NUDIX hydrolase domain-like protein [Tanacetum cinerariifolium]
MPPPSPSLSSLKPHQNPLQNSTFLPKPTSKHPPKKPHFLISPKKMPPSFTTPKSLSDYLKTRIPSDSLSSWGTQPGTKNIHNLFQELTSGETSLNDTHNPPLRTVNVVVVNIKDDKNRILIESHQELSNGDVRVRSRPLSEKMKMGENVEDAAVRAVKEELGKEGECVRVVKETCRSRVEERVSVSYPGLPACYVLHSVDVFVDGLPDCDEFWTVEEGEGQGEDDKAVKCRKHYWKWVDEGSANV